MSEISKIFKDEIFVIVRVPPPKDFVGRVDFVNYLDLVTNIPEIRLKTDWRCAYPNTQFFLTVKDYTSNTETTFVFAPGDYMVWSLKTGNFYPIKGGIKK